MKITFRLMILALLLNLSSFAIHMSLIFENRLTDRCVVAFTKKTIEDPAWAKDYWEILTEEIERARKED